MNQAGISAGQERPESLGRRAAFASLGTDPKRERSFELNLTVRKVADDLWLMWAGTGAYSWRVDRAGRLELIDGAK